MSLQKKVILITGATTELSDRLVHEFAEAGCSVAFCVPNPATLSAGHRDLLASNSAVLAVPCDVRYEQEVVRMVHRVVQRFERIDVLINAAVATGPRLPLMDLPAEAWREVLSVNLTGNYLVCREVLPWMVRQKAGQVINLTSSVVNSPRPQWGPFVASKAGVEGLTRTLVQELKGTGVSVHMLDAGTPATERRGGDRKQDVIKLILSTVATQLAERPPS